MGARGYVTLGTDQYYRILPKKEEAKTEGGGNQDDKR